MRVTLELNIVDEVGTFLDYWDYDRGNDVVCRVREGRLFLSGALNGDGRVIDRGKQIETEISLNEFITAVKASIQYNASLKSKASSSSND